MAIRYFGHKTVLFVAALTFVLSLIVNLALPASALNYGSGTYGTCTYGTCDIVVSSTSPVNISVTPTSGGRYSVLDDEVSVETDASTGYTLTFQDVDTNTNLVSGGNNIAAHSGTFASPSALSAANTWGYRVDGVGSFGAGPTSAQTSVSSLSGTNLFAGVPASNVTAHTIASTSVAANPADVTEIWYAVYVDDAIPAGTYTDTVVYTAVTND